eukprot:scaffold278940_cov35-Tisochrysis_lutea.AAC.4
MRYSESSSVGIKFACGAALIHRLETALIPARLQRVAVARVPTFMRRPYERIEVDSHGEARFLCYRGVVVSMPCSRALSRAWKQLSPRLIYVALQS